MQESNKSTEPGRTILSVPQVLKIRGGSRTKLYRDVRDGKFPAPVQTGKNSIGFFSDEVAENIDSLPRVHYAPPKDGAEEQISEVEAEDADRDSHNPPLTAKSRLPPPDP